jgi:hypothetical protein
MNELAGVHSPFQGSVSMRYQKPSGVTLGTLGAQFSSMISTWTPRLV